MVAIIYLAVAIAPHSVAQSPNVPVTVGSQRAKAAAVTKRGQVGPELPAQLKDLIGASICQSLSLGAPETTLNELFGPTRSLIYYNDWTHDTWYPEYGVTVRFDRDDRMIGRRYKIMAEITDLLRFGHKNEQP